ncbi:MAG TPA: hypothetical protein VGE21_02355 [Flavobacteriales bacterium]
MRVHHFLIVPFSIFYITEAYAQGCSDAGVCTAGPIGEVVTSTDSGSVSEEYRHMARLTFSHAIGERGTRITQLVVEAGIGLTERIGMQVKLPYLQAQGNLGNNSGIGDPTLTASYLIIKGSQRRMEAILGVKLPVNTANATADGKPLPMPYQTSLGTTDLLFGTTYRHRRFSAALAYQMVLKNDNANRFRHALWMDDMDALGYFESWDLDRADDAVVRIQYAVPWKRIVVQPGLLAIQHMGRDVRTEIPDDQPGMMRLPERVAVAGSDGLTLNITLDARYRIDDHWAIEASYGSPVITRSERPDGLTRSLVLNFGVRHAF